MGGARVTRGLRTRAAAVALAILAGCLEAHGQPSRGPLPANAPQVLFFGSSTVAGSGATATHRRWTSLLARRVGWREINAGLSGSTLTEVPGRAAASGEVRWRALAASGIHPSVVVLMYGANDAVASIPIGEASVPGTFRHAVAAVLRGLGEAFPDALLVVCTPQPGRRLQQHRRAPYDAALVQEARAAGAVVVRGDDAFAAEALPRFAADAIHLNDEGHAALAAHLERALRAEQVIPGARLARAERRRAPTTP
ncbi:lipolytic protein G-D-S-L family [Anaeromyxobacter sp. Fw109-5]|nr:lipolytic protein G-D-S-L family [Anaeromyxobacter sp. Fw109-5]